MMNFEVSTRASSFPPMGTIMRVVYLLFIKKEPILFNVSMHNGGLDKLYHHLNVPSIYFRVSLSAFNI